MASICNLDIFTKSWSSMISNDNETIDDYLPALPSPISLQRIFRAEAEFLQRIARHDENVRVLVARDVSVKALFMSSVTHSLKNVTMEVELLNGSTLTDRSIGDLFITKVQSAAHEKLINELNRQISRFVFLHKGLVVRRGLHLIEPGRIVRPDLALVPSTGKVPRFIVECEIDNRSTTNLHDHCMQFLDSIADVGALLSVNFSCRRPDTDLYAALAVLYVRNDRGQIVIGEMCDFGSADIDDDVLEELPNPLASFPMRTLLPRPGTRSNMDKMCPWDNSIIEVPSEVIIDTGGNAEPLSIDLWKLLITLESITTF